METIALRKCRAAFAALALAALCGCKTGTLPDPNDPKDIGALSPDQLIANLRATSDFLNARWSSGEIDDHEQKRLIKKRANELSDQIDLSRVDPDKAWEDGEILLAAQRWDLAKKALEIAIRHPKSEDRRITDHLRLARALAELGDVPQAVKVARTTFDCTDKESAAILPSVMLEILPAGLGKGHDVELANLLADAIPQEERAVVDPNTAPGATFLRMRPYQIHKAYDVLIGVYKAGNKPDLAQSAQKKLDAFWSEQAKRNLAAAARAPS